MSAAQWRKAMNSGAQAQAWPRQRRAATATAGAAPAPSDGLPDYSDQGAPAWLQWIWQRVGARHVFVLLAVLVYPLVATPFFTFQIGAQSLALGLIALSLTFLGGYGGMISLAQMTVAGIAGYMVAIFGVSGTAEISLGWPWWVVVPLAIAIATVCATLHRLALGAHRGHLHHHDHARDRRGLPLSRAAELQRVQRLPGAAEGLCAHGAGRQLGRAGPVLLP